MELRHLRSFVAVAEELHFGRAAERLHIAGPPLSKQIQQLEAELGFPLLERSTRRVTLTAGGLVFLDRARKLLRDVAEASVAAGRAHRGDSGQLSVGFAGSATYDLLPRVARRYRERHPGVELELHGEMQSARQIEALRKGQLDVGFVRPTPLPPEIASRTVWTETLGALVPADHRLAGRSSVDVAALAAEPFVSYSGVFADAVEVTCQRAGFEPRVVHRAAESYAVACLVASGFGVALVPQAARHLQLTELRYLEIPSEQSEQVELHMVWVRNSTSPVVRNFLRITRAVLAVD